MTKRNPPGVLLSIGEENQMPERIETAQIAAINSDVLEIDDAYPGTFGFYVRLSRDPGEEWAVEFHTAYDTARYPGKPPITYRGDTLCVFYLPRYADELGQYLQFLGGIVRETNHAVDLRNRALPDEEKEKTDFRAKLREAAQAFQK